MQNEEEANKEDDWPWMVWYDLLPCQGTAALRRLRARRAPWAVVEPVVDATRYDVFPESVHGEAAKAYRDDLIQVFLAMATDLGFTPTITDRR